MLLATTRTFNFHSLTFFQHNGDGFMVMFMFVLVVFMLMVFVFARHNITSFLFDGVLYGEMEKMLGRYIQVNNLFMN